MKSLAGQVVVVNQRHGPFQILPFFCILGLIFVGGLTIVIAYHMVYETIATPASPVAILEIVVLWCFVAGLGYIAYGYSRLVVKYARDIRKVSIGSHGVRIYRTYGKSIEIFRDDGQAKYDGLDRVTVAPDEEDSAAYSISFVFKNENTLSFKCSRANTGRLREALNALGITVVETSSTGAPQT